MPNPYVQKLAKKRDMSVKNVEKKWKKAKEIAKDRNKAKNFAFITSIFKNMMHEEGFTGSFKDFITLTEMSDESYDRAPRGDRFEFDDEDEFNDSQDNPFDDENDEEDFDDELGDEDDSSYEEDFDDELGDEDDSSYEEDFDDESGDDELGNEEDFDDESGHKLADIIGPDELNDEDEFGDEDDVRESVSSGLLKELMILTEKKKKSSLKKAAKLVYHRDYIKTRKRPYRKYHPEDHYTNESFVSEKWAKEYTVPESKKGMF